MKRFTITMTQVVADQVLDSVDKQMYGMQGENGVVLTWTCKAKHFGSALDMFHGKFPIKQIMSYAIHIGNGTAE